jgi:hypothetical protein
MKLKRKKREARVLKANKGLKQGWTRVEWGGKLSNINKMKMKRLKLERKEKNWQRRELKEKNNKKKNKKN